MPVAELLLIVMQIHEIFLLNFMNTYIGIFSLGRSPQPHFAEEV